MPNWCNNTTMVQGDEEQLKQFLRKITNKDSSIHLTNLMKMPAVLGKNPAKLKKYNEHPLTLELAFEKEQLIKEHQDLCYRITGHKNSYDWACAEWGTKWGDCYTHHVSDSTTNKNPIMLNYETAWGPFENNFWCRVSSKFPRLYFINLYDEWGCEFSGAEVWCNGILLHRETGNGSDLKYDEYCPEEDNDHQECNCNENAILELSDKFFRNACNFVENRMIEPWLR